MPWLIHLNGPSGVGKSTFARRWVKEHPGSLNLDADVVLSLIGGWETDFFATLAPARTLAVAMATAHLRTGHDVVLPQLVTRADEAEQFEDAARSADAAYVEVALVADVEEQIGRFRGKVDDDQVHRHIAREVDSLGGDARLRTIDADFAQYLSHRPKALRVDTSGTQSEATYARLMSLLEVRCR